MEELEDAVALAAAGIAAAPFVGVASCVSGRPISLVVLDLVTLEVKVRIDVPGWNEFRPSTAGARLIERGYMALPQAHYEPDAAAGWRRLGDSAYVVPLVPVSVAVG